MKKYLKLCVLIITFFLFNQVSFGINQYQTPVSGKNFDRNTIMSLVTKYSQKISSEPNSQGGYINRAYFNYILGNIDAAISDYDTLITLNPRNEEFYLNRGYLKHISYRRAEALEDYKMALKINPKYTFAYNNIGVVLAEMGKVEESLTCYDNAIKLDPNYADAYYNRGNLNTRLQKNEEALNDFNLAIKFNPTDSASFNNRGVVKRRMNCNVGALSDFSIAIKLDPDDMIAYSNRGHLKKRYFDSEGAEDDFQKAMAVANVTPNLTEQIVAKNKASVNPKAIAVASTPVSYESAPAELNKALRMPKVSQATLQKLKSKQIDNIANKPSSNVIQASVVKINPAKTNLAANKEPVIETKPVKNPELAECYYIRGLQKYILQNREGALADFNQAIENDSKYAEAYYYRAAIRRDLKDEKYVDDYRMAVKLNPELKVPNDANTLNILK